MIRVVILYMLASLSVAGVIYGIPALRRVGTIHKRKLFFSLGLGFILVTLIYLGEQVP